MVKKILTVNTWLLMAMTSSIEVMKGLLPAFLQDALSLSASEVGALFSMSFFALVLSNALGGVILRFVTVRFLYLTSLLVFASACLLLAIFLTEPTAWYSLLFIIGFSNGFGSLLANVLTPALYPLKSGKMLSIVHFFFGIGTMTAPYFFLLFFNGIHYEWQWVLISFAVIALVLVFSVWMTGWPIERQKGPSKRNVLQREWKVIGAVGFALLFFFYMGSEIVFTVWLVAIFREAYQLPVQTASILFSIIFALYTFTRLFGAGMIERIGAHRLIRWSAVLSLVTIVCAFLGLGTWGMTFFFLFGMTIAVIFPAMTSIAVRYFGADASRMMGYLFACGFLGGSFSSWLFGFMLDRITIEVAFTVLLFFFTLFTISVLGGLQEKGETYETKNISRTQ
ncbi:sugar MFS transporter [Halalkalibacter sp. AB-rgal2]|uniref:MFS transporter n=1 Tax=Halalkalibacter sp. AB-rgal2 TaxID=3242695 RepID=UPI00359E7BAA